MIISATYFSVEQLRDKRRGFDDRGETITDWAKAHDFRPALVYAVLAGKQRCVRGQSHQIAIALGLKKGVEPETRSTDVNSLQ